MVVIINYYRGKSS